MKKIFSLLFVLLLTFSITGCDKDQGASSDFRDPYEAYGLKKGEGGLANAMLENPPKAISFQPFLLQAFKPEGVEIERAEITLAKGEKETLTFDEAIVYSEKGNKKSTGFVTATVEITYNPVKYESLFTVYNEVSSKMLHQREGYPDKVQGEKNYKGETIYQIGKILDVPGLPDDDYLYFVLGQKGTGGNSGMIICQITGVKR